MALLENQEKQKFHANNKPDFVYLCADVGSVFESQVISLLKFYKLQHKFHSIHLVCGIRNEKEKSRTEDAAKRIGVDVLFFENSPNYFFYRAVQRKKIATALEQLPQVLKNPIVHIRGELLAYHAAGPLRAKWGSLNRVLVDVRGAGWEEVLEFQNIPRFVRFLKKPNYTKAFAGLRNFGAVSVVSEALKEYVSKRTELPQVYVVPCLVSDSFRINPEGRDKIRRKIGIQEGAKLLVFSSGGNAGWQQSIALKNLVSDQWQILNLSHTRIDSESVINLFVSYEEMPEYLAAADAAIVLREQSTVNKVACPVKFCEYLCAGLPVIGNASVELIKRTIELQGFGILITSPADLHQLPVHIIFNHNRDKIAQYGKNHFGISAVAEKYSSIYEILL